MQKSIPSVAIVGRTNVGKSTLFNRLSESVKSITLDYEGVTRDVITDIVCWRDITFELVDTGGISLRKIVDPIAEVARQRAIDVVERANLVLFVCDGTVGVTQEDRELAKFIHKLNKSAILVVNKIDTNIAKAQVYEFERLGFNEPVSVSAQHGIGIPELFEAILEKLPERVTAYKEEEEPVCKVVILGKPNVGKSSLMNLLLKRERSIVADIPGTTRESIKEQVRFYQELIQIADTPGVRRKRGVTQPIEKLMVKSALRTTDDADIVLLMVDASQARMVDQDLKLAFYVFEEQHKGLIILFNKEDLMDDEKSAKLKFNLKLYEHFLKKVVQMRISCISHKNIGKLMKSVSELCKRYNQRFDDLELSTLFKEALYKKPLYKSERRLIFYHAQQVKTGPIVIKLLVSEPQLFGPSQIAFFDNVLRKHANLKGVPVRFVTRKK